MKHPVHFAVPGPYLQLLEYWNQTEKTAKHIKIALKTLMNLQVSPVLYNSKP